jgi:hypothetical protein
MSVRLPGFASLTLGTKRSNGANGCNHWIAEFTVQAPFLRGRKSAKETRSFNAASTQPPPSDRAGPGKIS